MIFFKHPSTFLISGSTQSGKTRFVLRMLNAVRHDVFFEKPIRRILYCYDEYQPVFEHYRSFVNFHKGLPTNRNKIFDGRRPSLLIIDDLMESVNKFVANIFTKISHHRNLSVVYVCQNLFDKSKHHRTISLNSHYIVLLRNPRDTQHVAVLARQIFASDWRVATEAYREATREQYRYFSIFIRAPKIVCVSERTSFPGSGRTPILRRSRTSELSVDVWLSSSMQHEEPRIANLTILRLAEDSYTLTFDYVEIVLIILLLLITIAIRVFYKTDNINQEAADVTDNEKTVEETASTLSAVETYQ